MLPPHQNYSTEGRKSQSERIKVRLSSDLRPAIVLVVFLFREHIIHDSDREQIKLREGQPDLDTSEKEEGRCHRAVSFAMFFLDSACVSTLSPHSSMSCGSTS